jgi:large subunit ribosomal protein L18
MRINRFLQRKLRVKARVRGNKVRPRLSVFRSNKGIYAQIIDDTKKVTLVSASSREVKTTKGVGKIDVAASVGQTLAKKALAKKIRKVVFDKSGYKYHGRIKALADAARKEGLEF